MPYRKRCIRIKVIVCNRTIWIWYIETFDCDLMFTITIVKKIFLVNGRSSYVRISISGCVFLENSIFVIRCGRNGSSCVNSGGAETTYSVDGNCRRGLWIKTPWMRRSQVWICLSIMNFNFECKSLGSIINDFNLVARCKSRHFSSSWCNWSYICASTCRWCHVLRWILYTRGWSCCSIICYFIFIYLT